MTEEQNKELQELSNVVDNCHEGCDNFLNEFEPGSEEYNILSECAAGLKKVFTELEKLKK